MLIYRGKDFQLCEKDIHNSVSFFEKKTLKKYPFYEKLVGKENRYWINNLIINKKLKSLYDPELKVDHHYTETGNI